jgi:hypothetical protein
MVENACELTRARAAMAARFLRFGDDRGKEEEGMDVRGLDGSRDTLLCVGQLAKVPCRAWCVEDTRRRWPETIGHPVL